MPAGRPSDDIHRIAAELADQGRAYVLALVLQTAGSTPCKAGAKAVITADGAIQGTIGGGLVEAETQRRAAETIRAGRPVVLDFDLESGSVGGDRPICGGAMRVLLDPTACRHQAAYAAASAARARRHLGVLLATVRGSTQREVAVEFLAEPAIPADLGFPGAEAVRSVLAREEPRLFVSAPAPDAERVEVLVEPLVPKPVLLVAGGGHVGQAVAAQASLVGFDVLVIDDRPEFARPEQFPEGVGVRCGRMEEEVSRLSLGPDTYVVIVTRGHQHDADVLAACLARPAAYVGMIGSRRKVAMMREDFVTSGRASPEAFDRVYAPIGLDLGAVTVPEIAASIVAQLIAVRRKGTSPRIPTR